MNTRAIIPQIITVSSIEEDNHSTDSPILPVDISTQYTTSPIPEQNPELACLFHNHPLLAEEQESGDSNNTASTGSIDSKSTGSSYHSMSDADNPTKVQDLFLVENLVDLTPILTPTRMQIITYTGTVATALTQCRSKLGLLGAQAYLVITEEEYKMRVNNPDKGIPIRPGEPDPYDNNTYTRRSWKEFEHKLALYSETHKYDWQVITLIKLKFPKSLHGL